MSEENNNTNTQEQERQNKIFGLIWKRIRQFFLGLVLLVISIYLIFQIPYVQNWAVQELTTKLSETLDSRVSLDRFYLLFIDKLEIENFYVEDAQAQDTLLFSRKLYVDINSNIFTLLRRGIIIQDVQLRNAQFNIRKQEGATENNLQFLLSKLFKPDTARVDEERRPFQMDLEHVYLEDVLFEKDDKVRGQRFKMYVGRGEIEINELSLPENRIDISTLYLADPIVEIDEFPEVLPPGEEAVQEELSEQDTSEFRIFVDQFSLLNGHFDFNNYRRSPERMLPEDQIDYDHMQVRDIDVLIEQFDFDVIQHDYRGMVRNFSLRENSGFRVESLKAKEAAVNCQEMILNDFKLVTPYSTLGDTLHFSYDSYYDYRSFVDDIVMDGKIRQSAVAVKDIITFAPALKDNAFFRSNQEKVLDLQGNVSGSVNNLRGRQLDIRLADGSIIRGRFNSDSLAVRDQEVLQLKLEQLTTSVRTLRQLIPGFDLPSNFDNLGRLDFQGRFTGFFADFVAEGALKTDIGNARMNMHMDFKQGRDKATYDGNLSLENFDLGIWSNNADFGLISATSSVKNGFGLSADIARADLSADIKQFTFKNYTYKDAKITGVLAQNLFNGNMDFKDDNVDFKFMGEVNFQDSVPKFDFYASINRFALQQVNLSEKDMVISGEVELQLQNQRNIGLVGEGNIADLLVTYQKNKQYQLRKLFAHLDFGPLGRKHLTLRSDLVDATLVGAFEITEIPNALMGQFKKVFPGITYHLGIRDSFPVRNQHDFSFDIAIKDSKGFNRLLDDKLGRLQNITTIGYFDNVSDSIEVKINVPELSYNEFTFYDIACDLNLLGDEGDLGAIVGQTDRKGEELFPRVTLLSVMKGDTIDFGVNYAATSLSLLDDLNLNGEFSVQDSTFMQVAFNQSNLAILKKPWAIDRNNSILFSRDSVFVENFKLRHQEETISLKSVNGKSINLALDSFNFNFIDDVWEFEPFDFEGTFGAEVSVKNIFELTGIQASVFGDSLFINDDDWGRVRIDVDVASLQSPLYANANITKSNSQILIDGYYNLPNADQPKSNQLPTDRQSNYFEFNTEIYNFPLDFASYFIGSNVSDILGNFEADVQLSGFPEKPNIAGFLRAYNGAFTIDYLNTRYHFDESFINIDNQLFDASGTIMKDRDNNEAVLFGGITHKNLKNFGLNARLKTDRLLAMNVPKSRNELYYGKAFGAGNILFTGDFERTDILVDATVGESTELYIPVTSTTGNSNIDFIDFVDKYNKNYQPGTENEDEDNRIRGLSLDMNLNVTEKAKVEIIFNEQAGDKISGRGRGNLQILIPRGSDMQMFGNYVIEEGDYLFTLYNIASKKFTVKRGGTIIWNGDPLAANINLEAQYGDIRTSVANFIPEYLASSSDGLVTEASQPTKVDLSLQLQGELLQPVISFDIKFPDVRGRLATFLDSKMRTLRQDLNSLNRQVFGLIVVGQFLPSDFAFTGTDVIYNTLSEFVSNQLSVLVTELFSEVINEGSALSGIDFDIAYYQSQNLNFPQGEDISAGEEFQIGQRLNFYNDKLVVYLGGNVEIGNPVQAPTGNGTFIGNDLVVEYTLNEDRSLKLRFYQRLQPDVGGGRKLQVGTGLSYRKEFDSFGEFWRSLKKDVKDD